MTRLTLALIGAVIPLFAQNAVPAKEGLTRAEAALLIAQQLHLPHTSDPTTLYGTFNNPFPGGYDGRGDITYWDQPVTTEVLMVVLVRHSGWDTTRYPEKRAKQAAPFVSPEGFPYYGPAPTPRSIPYISVALEQGLLTEAELPGIRQAIGRTRVLEYLERYRRIASAVRILPPEVMAQGKLSAFQPQYPAQLVVIPRGVPKGPVPQSWRNPVLDFRGPGVRLFSGPSGIGNGMQDYFPLGALETVFSAGLAIPKDSLAHQGEAIYGLVENNSSTVNAVGIWGAGQSLAGKARVWGGFLTAASAYGADKDAQLVGLEVDVVNHSRAGISPNASKVGIQVVGIGEAEVTNGIEILAAGPALWNNGILISDHAISENGTIIGVSQSSPVKLGIDLSHTRFNQAAVLVSNRAPVAFRSKSGADAGVYTDDFGNGSLVLRAGQDGLRITNNQDTRNLVVIQEDGSLDHSSLLWRHYSRYVWLALLLVMGMGVINVWLFRQLRQMERRIGANDA